jgi:hypothetical protein
VRFFLFLEETLYKLQHTRDIKKNNVQSVYLAIICLYIESNWNISTIKKTLRATSPGVVLPLRGSAAEPWVCVRPSTVRFYHAPHVWSILLSFFLLSTVRRCPS